MTLTNSQIATLIDAIKSVGKVDNAQAAFAKRVDAMRQAGFVAAWFETKSDQIEMIREKVARAALTEVQYNTWRDDSLAVKVKVKGSDKRVDTARGKLVKLVDQRILRLRKALTEPTPKGAKGNAPRALDQRIKDELAKLVNAIKKDDGETLPCDHKELLTAFAHLQTRINDLLSKH
jgi:hydroxypyruvate isomerase